MVLWAYQYLDLIQNVKLKNNQKQHKLLKYVIHNKHSTLTIQFSRSFTFLFTPYIFLVFFFFMGEMRFTISQDYVRHSSLLINLAKAIGRLVAAQKQIQSFIGKSQFFLLLFLIIIFSFFLGYSSLISDFIDSLNDIHSGKLQRRVAASGDDIRGNGILIESPNIEFRHVRCYVLYYDVVNNTLALLSQFYRCPNFITVPILSLFYHFPDIIIS